MSSRKEEEIAPNQDTGIDLNASKLRTSCKELAKASYACLEKQTGPDAKTVCQPFFTAYKECRKAEHDGIVEERRKRFGN